MFTLASLKNKSEWSKLFPLKYLVEAKLVNDKKIVSIDIASMILRKYEQSVLQSLCLTFSTFFFHFIIYMQFIFIESALSKIKPMLKFL